MTAKQIFMKFLNLKKTDYMIIVLVGVLLLIIAMPVKKSTSYSAVNEPVLEEDTYKKSLEAELTDILMDMDGINQVKVMINMSYKTSEGYMDKEKEPVVEGVLVVADGIITNQLYGNISESIQALFGIGQHKIKIVKMKSQEESE